MTLERTSRPSTTTAAAAATTRAVLEHRPSEVINIGSAGALRDGLAGLQFPGTVVNHDFSADLVRALGFDPQDELEVPPYQIPLRSLIARDGKNLLMAGRCFSCDQLALSSARVITTCSMMGQAAGITAALAVQQGCDVRDVAPAEVRRIVLERGAILDV